MVQIAIVDIVAFNLYPFGRNLIRNTLTKKSAHFSFLLLLKKPLTREDII